MPRSWQVRMTRSAISPRFATRIDVSGAVLSLLGVGPRGRPRVLAVPRLERAVDPLRLALHARDEAPVEPVLLGRIRVLHVGLFGGEVHDHARATGFAVLPEDLGVDVPRRAHAFLGVPLAAEAHEVAQALFLQLEARDRPVHGLASLERDIAVLTARVGVPLAR